MSLSSFSNLSLFFTFVYDTHVSLTIYRSKSSNSRMPWPEPEHAWEKCARSPTRKTKEDHYEGIYGPYVVHENVYAVPYPVCAFPCLFACLSIMIFPSSALYPAHFLAWTDILGQHNLSSVQLSCDYSWNSCNYSSVCYLGILIVMDPVHRVYSYHVLPNIFLSYWARFWKVGIRTALAKKIILGNARWLWRG